MRDPRSSATRRFELAEGDARVLIDPFLAPDNPAATRAPTRSSRPTSCSPTATATTSPTRSRSPSAPARTASRSTELAGWLGEQGVENAANPNLGGTVEFDWGSVKLVPAWHTNTTPDGDRDRPGRRADHRDRRQDRLPPRRHGLFGDLKLIGERHRRDVALVPIGGHFTMDRHDAAVRLRADRRPDRDPVPLQHLPADRGRRRRVQGGGRGRPPRPRSSSSRPASRPSCRRGACGAFAFGALSRHFWH